MSDSHLRNSSDDPVSQSGLLAAAIADARFDRAHVPLDHLIIRVHDEPERRSVITEGGRARIVASELSDYVEIVAVSEGKYVPLVGFSLFNELRASFPEGRPTKEFTVRTLIAPRRSLAVTIKPVEGPDGEQRYQIDVSANNAWAFAPDWRDNRQPSLALVAIVIAVVVAVGSLLLRRNSLRLAQSNSQTVSPEQSQSSPGANLSVRSTPMISIPNVESTPGLKAVSSVDAIVDGNMSVRIRSNGAIQGLENLPPEIASDVESALLDPAGLSIEPAYKPPSRGFTLMGATGKAEPSLQSPFGVVLRERRPSFAWTALDGADSYEVMVRDLSTDAIAASTERPIPATGWTPAKQLERGHLYGWIVTANREGNRVRIPSTGMGKFKVLDDAGERKLRSAETQAPKSRLVRAVVMYRLGLIDEAQREFALLKKSNPKSQAVRSLSLHANQTKGP